MLRRCVGPAGSEPSLTGSSDVVGLTLGGRSITADGSYALSSLLGSGVSGDNAHAIAHLNGGSGANRLIAHGRVAYVKAARRSRSVAYVRRSAARFARRHGVATVHVIKR